LVTFEISVDPDLCVGSGDCVRLSPRAFQIDEPRGVSVAQADAPDEPLELILEAAIGCPTQAIRVVTEDGHVLHASNGG
jgi:ferredoxin